MSLSTADLAYFARGADENPRFWARLGGKPNLSGAAVLDLGCGHGSLAIDIAQAGAQRVLGLDLNAGLVEFAAENLHAHYPGLGAVVTFRYQDIRETPEAAFDAIVSKDTFEHVFELDQVLAAVAARLRPGGRLYAGIGPLWHSPFGDHGRTRMGLPWAHAVLPEAYLIRRLNRRWRTPVTSIYDLGLNKLALADYLRLLRASGLNVVSLRVNASSHPLSRLFSLARHLPGLGEYLAHNLYCILEKPA